MYKLLNNVTKKICRAFCRHLENGDSEPSNAVTMT